MSTNNVSLQKESIVANTLQVTGASTLKGAVTMPGANSISASNISLSRVSAIAAGSIALTTEQMATNVIDVLVTGVTLTLPSAATMLATKSAWGGKVAAVGDTFPFYVRVYNKKPVTIAAGANVILAQTVLSGHPTQASTLYVGYVSCYAAGGALVEFPLGSVSFQTLEVARMTRQRESIPTPAAKTGAATLTAAEVAAKVITNTVTGTLTLPTAALLLADTTLFPTHGAAAAVGDTIRFTVVSDNAVTTTVGLGAGITVFGGTLPTAAAGNGQSYMIRFTNVTASSEAAVIYAC